MQFRDAATAKGSRAEQPNVLFAAGHKIACGEVLALCADYAEPTEKLGNAAAAFQVLASSITGDLSPELASRITDLLRQFGVDEVTSYTLE